MPGTACFYCDYNLSGVPLIDGKFICPECGKRTPDGFRRSDRVPFRAWAVAFFVGLGLLIVIMLWVARLGERGPWFVSAVLIVCTAAALNGCVALKMQRRLSLPARASRYAFAGGVAMVTALLGLVVACCAGTLGEYANV